MSANSETTLALVTLIQILTEQPNFDKAAFSESVRKVILSAEAESKSKTSLVTLKTILRSVLPKENDK